MHGGPLCTYLLRSPGVKSRSLSVSDEHLRPTSLFAEVDVRLIYDTTTHAYGVAGVLLICI